MSTPLPRASLVLLSYNQQQLLPAAARACLAQDCEPLEIVFSDDASNDGSFELLQQIATDYRGPHHVSVRRNERNLGIGGHYNQLVEVTQGELIVTAAGDDISLPHRVRRLLQAWDEDGNRADLIASHVIDLDQEGRLHEPIRVDDLARCRGLDDWLRGRPYVIGASHAFTRRLMRRFGPMAPDVFYEDQVMVLRAILGGGALTVDEPLLHYRRGGISGRTSFGSGDALKAWTTRQAARHVAEMEQLLADARLAGCFERVAANLELPLRRARYLQKLAASDSAAARWQTLRDESALPFGWRFKKLLHASFPDATARLKRLRP